MKKLFLFLSIFSLLLTGCDIYTDKSKKDMELVEVKVYDKVNNEVIGTYKNYRTFKNENTILSVSNDITLLNSAAPVENYYYVNAKENEPYIVKFYFKSAKGYELTKLVLNNDPENYYSEKTECSEIAKEDNYYVATLSIDKIEATNQYYHTIAWYRKNVEVKYGTSGSNTYIKGVYFSLEDIANTLC